jgi:hypothetical protein
MIGWVQVFVAAIHSPAAIALIGALAGIAGAVAGGAASGFATYKIEGRRQGFARRQALRQERRERERNLALVRASARVWARSLHLFETDVRVAVNHGAEWWTDDLALYAPVGEDDRKLVASEATDAEWRAIDRAESRIATTHMRRRLARAGMDDPESLGPVMTEEGKTGCLEAADQVHEAIDALNAISRRTA